MLLNLKDVIKDVMKAISKKRVKCAGIVTSNGRSSQCSKYASGDCDFCKVHSARKLPPQLSTRTPIEVEYIFDTSEKVHTEDFARIFIEEAFYYVDVDRKYIYTKEGLKVGVVTGDTYFLTNDPYVLDEM